MLFGGAAHAGILFLVCEDWKIVEFFEMNTRFGLGAQKLFR